MFEGNVPIADDGAFDVASAVKAALDVKKQRKLGQGSTAIKKFLKDVYLHFKLIFHCVDDIRSNPTTALFYHRCFCQLSSDFLRDLRHRFDASLMVFGEDGMQVQVMGLYINFLESIQLPSSQIVSLGKLLEDHQGFSNFLNRLELFYMEINIYLINAGLMKNITAEQQTFCNELKLFVNPFLNSLIEITVLKILDCEDKSLSKKDHVMIQNVILNLEQLETVSRGFGCTLIESLKSVKLACTNFWFPKRELAPVALRLAAR